MRLSSLLSYLLSVLLCGGLSATLVQATTTVDQTFADLVHQADVIAIGTITGVQERWDATRQAPMTDVTFSQLTLLTGNPGEETLTLEFLGGHRPDGTVLAIAGIPQFIVGEKSVVFVAGNHTDFCPLVGLWQGRLRVAVDPRRGIETVHDNFHRPILGVQEGRLLTATSAEAAQEALPLTTLQDLIRTELGNAYEPK